MYQPTPSFSPVNQLYFEDRTEHRNEVCVSAGATQHQLVMTVATQNKACLKLF